LQRVAVPIQQPTIPPRASDADYAGLREATETLLAGECALRE
jgi:hypothetical protein